MEQVQVRVQFRERAAIVNVPEDAFRTRCWKPIAALAAAVDLEAAFADVEREARYGLRPEDKARLVEAIGNRR